MSDGLSDDEKRKVIESWLQSSLEKVHAALSQWKAGELTVIEAHREVMRHAIEGQEVTASVPNPAPSKQTVAEHLLQEGSILIHCDARRDGVEVPDAFRVQGHLTLRFGYGLTPAIPDLVVNSQGIAGTLTFHGVPFHVSLPWTSVFVVAVDGEPRGMVWPEDAPADLQAQVNPPPAPPTEPETKKPNHLKLV